VRRPTLEYFVRQPDGTGCVVSDAAELDAEPVLGVGHRSIVPETMRPLWHVR